MSRNLRTTLPMTAAALEPRIQQSVPRGLETNKAQMMKWYNRSASNKDDTFSTGETGLVNSGQQGEHWLEGIIIAKASTPRSYWVKTVLGNEIRRTSGHLRKSNLH
ncbi:hypothetical protein PR048_008990 [Dryococelus australis]|uniref:Uncharacterized protein n=1 Tax=Dryococelus australis TaxID=614101 RepID=A0ABQ9HZF5_9NEOP|nr:hypothetical protein PR048_008990 [Dryococelus australis]